MAKLKFLLAAISFLTTYYSSKAQSYAVYYKTPEGDTSISQKLSLQNLFFSQGEASLYVAQIPSLLQNKGYITSSLDSVRFDSLSASAVIYLGEQYKWAKITTRLQDASILQSIRWPENLDGPIDFMAFQRWQKKILDFLEENGRPFGKVYLDSIDFNGNEVNALLKIEPGSRLATTVEAAVVQPVQVHLQELLLGVAHLQLPCLEHLLQFHQQGASGGRVGDFDNLLSNRRSPGDSSPPQEVVPKRAGQREAINPSVVQEAFVFGSKRCLLKHGRNSRQGNMLMPVTPLI